MLKSIPLKALISLLMVTFVIMASSSSSSWGVDARYLPTRSDPLSPIGPPRGEDSRFDRLYDNIIKEVFRYILCGFPYYYYYYKYFF
jgi:hypothetical protein